MRDLFQHPLQRVAPLRYFVLAAVWPTQYWASLVQVEADPQTQSLDRLQVSRSSVLRGVHGQSKSRGQKGINLRFSSVEDWDYECM